jgi:hypothetical protein
MAAEQGDAEAQSYLGKCTKVTKACLKTTRRQCGGSTRAEKKSSDCDQYNIGTTNMIGESVPQNREEAARWFQMAADQSFA